MFDSPPKKLIFTLNPGSSSRKYALFDGALCLLTINFEFEDGKIICKTRNFRGHTEKSPTDLEDLDKALYVAFHKVSENFFDMYPNELAVFAIRAVAPGDFFTKDHFVDDNFLAKLRKVERFSPLHVPIVISELEIVRKLYPAAKILAVSDSAFHNTMPPFIKYYPTDMKTADEFGIKRYGYHSLSLEQAVRTLKSKDSLPDKAIILHLGSGSSVTAIKHGKSLNTSMGFSPLEGLSSSTRSGSIDVSAALAIKEALNLPTNDDLEKYLNVSSGLLGVSQKSGDMREIIKNMLRGDLKSHIAFTQYIYSVVGYIGKMYMTLGGADALIFTGAMGFRSALVRASILKHLEHLDFHAAPQFNINDPKEPFLNIAPTGKKPIFVIKTNEARALLHHAINAPSTSSEL
jgi:acetate kinase